MVWGVLRGAREDDTQAVLRIAPAGGAYVAVSIDGVDPFTQARRVLFARSPLGTSLDVRTPRATFADLPRREIHFFSGAEAADPTLTVYFMGLPDTTPEFTSEAALHAYLGETLAKADDPERTHAMTRQELARLLDHSVLKPDATEREVLAGADLVRQWGIGFYCVQPTLVSAAAAALQGSEARVVSVVGFPHGCARSVVKAQEATLAVQDGAAEVDMVLNVGKLKSGRSQAVASEIAQVVRAVPGIPVKVILETCLLTDEEKTIACRLVQDAGAAFVKTSTGFHPGGGATVADVRLMRATVGQEFGVKAAGGIRTLQDVLAMLEAGANRIGTSASAAILGALPLIRFGDAAPRTPRDRALPMRHGQTLAISRCGFPTWGRCGCEVTG